MDSVSEPSASGVRDDGRARERDAHERDQVDAGPTVAVPASEEQKSAESNPAIIAESIAALKRLSVGEAVMELDVTGASVLVFRHAGHGRVNLVYRRADGHIGWIDPPTVEQDAH